MAVVTITITTDTDESPEMVRAVDYHRDGLLDALILAGLKPTGQTTTIED